MGKLWGSICAVMFLVSTQVCLAQSLGLTAAEVPETPEIDGDAGDPAWKGVVPVPVKDQASGMMIFIKAVRHGDMLYFHVMYPDAAENFLHEPWIWNDAQKKYETGKEREDTFVFKWNMNKGPVDLSNFSDDNYTADIWYWKANRTNLAGYADDKTQTLSDKPHRQASETISASGKKRYLLRTSDAGSPPYSEVKPGDYSDKFVQRYIPKPPSGSRGDVRARGVWKGGFWSIEFARKLNTGHSDDLQFDPESDRPYLFGVSIFSLYGRLAEKDGCNFYGLGRISEPIYLRF